MASALLIGRLLLGGVFLVAAMAKLLDLPGSRNSLEQLGLPTSLVPGIAVALPLVELCVGVGLVPVATAWPAALGACLLLAAFTVAVGAALARGVEADCHCFGRVSSRPIGPGTLLRNVALLAVAAFIAIAGFHNAGTSATGWVRELSTGEVVLLGGGIALALALAFNTAFLFQLFKQNGRLWAELEELRAADGGGARGQVPQVGFGELAPSFALPDLSGRVVELDDLLDEGRSLLLFFSDPGCSACDPLLAQASQRQGDPSAANKLVMISNGDAEAIRAKASEHGFDLVLLLDSFELPRSLGIGGVPGVIVLDTEGRVASEPITGKERVSTFLDSATELSLVQVGGSR